MEKAFKKLVKKELKRIRIEEALKEISGRLTRIEKALKTRPAAKIERKQTVSATNEIMAVIKDSGKSGCDYGHIFMMTGRDEKQVRNVIYRLTKLGKICKPARGIYADAVWGSF